MATVAIHVLAVIGALAIGWTVGTLVGNLLYRQVMKRLDAEFAARREAWRYIDNDGGKS